MITDLHVSKYNIIERENMLRDLCVGETHLNTVPTSPLPRSLSWSTLLAMLLPPLDSDQFTICTTITAHIPGLGFSRVQSPVERPVLCTQCTSDKQWLCSCPSSLPDCKEPPRQGKPWYHSLPTHTILHKGWVVWHLYLHRQIYTI